ncbi:MAG: glycoside hydrolase family 3 protein [Treponema sp.]|nr:glycoside hydrolase family 3 protein [Treponema sp.]
MKKSLKISVIILSLLLICSVTGVLIAQSASRPDLKEEAKRLPSNVDFWSDYPSDVLAQALVDRMTDTELLSQVMMFGWAGAEPNDLLFRWVDRGLGSVKVFGWNTDDINLVAKSVSRLQRRASNNRFRIPLYVATDQEGGWIRHVKGDTSITPGNMAIGAAGYPVDSWYSAFYICREIKALGINMNFAPTIDLFTDHNSTIIGPRSFGEDPDKSGILGAAYAAGCRAAGVIPTVKHFPGHGDTNLDSHGKLPVINIDYNTLINRELVPYKYMIKDNVPAIMSGHLSFPKIDSSGAPASLSKYFLTDLLRGELGYEGLVITDDMQMVGATAFAGSFSNAVRLALEAGNDIILSSSTARLEESMWTVNLNLMGSNEEFKNIVKTAAYRVIKSKLEYFKTPEAAPLYPDPNKVSESVPDKEGEVFFLEQACRSITVEKKGILPLEDKEGQKVLFAGSLQSFFKAGRARYSNSSQYYFPYDEVNIDDTQSYANQLSSMARSYDVIVVCVSNAKHARIAEGLKKSKKKVIIFSTMAPTFAEGLTWADTILLGYSWRCDYTMEAMIAALAGDFVPSAIKPYN